MGGVVSNVAVAIAIVLVLVAPMLVQEVNGSSTNSTFNNILSINSCISSVLNIRDINDGTTTLMMFSISYVLSPSLSLLLLQS